MLEMERLLRESKTADGKTKEEAVMLLNHKDALRFVLDNPDYLQQLTLVFLLYIQAFSDGNKCTARITSNAILIANGYCPLSFRSVDSIDYKKAMLIFYEQNSLYAFKQKIIDQFDFAVREYF